MGTKYKLLAAIAFCALVLPGVSLAQTQSVASLQAELQTLLAQVQSLEAQLAAAGGSTMTWCYTFNSNLSIGMSGAGVTALQTALQKDGESVTVNGTFDDQTAAAVTTFQQKYQSAILAPYGLSNGTGYAGKGTRAELNSLFGCTGSNPVTPPIVINPIIPTPAPISNPTPLTPTITGVNSAGATPTPGSNEFLIGSNLPTQNATIVVDPGSTSAQTITPTGYNVGGGGNMTFYLPSGTSLGSHTIEVQSSGATSNAFGFTVVAAPVTTAAPYVSQVNPTTAAPGATVTVSGQNFDANSFISLGNVPTGPENFPVAVTSETPTTLTFTVPSNFAVGAQPLYVAEHNSSLVSNEGTLTISGTPYISQLNPTAAAPGALVTVSGQNFDGNSYISLGNVPTGPENFPVAVTSETPTTLTFTVPSNFAIGPQPLYVAEHNSSLVSNKGTLTISAAPYVSQVNPTTAAPGATVTVSGQNFDANSFISLGNVPTGPENFPVAVTSETPTTLTFTVPSNFAVGAQPLYVAEHNSSLVSNEGTLTISTQ